MTSVPHRGGPVPERNAQAPPIACTADPGFVQWLAASGGSLAISTYQAGKLLLVGWNGQSVSFLPRNFDKPMGLDVRDDRFVLATRHGITQFANTRELAYQYRKPGEYDALYLPRVTHHMPDLAIHDLAYVEDEVWFVNTRMNCLATLSSRYTFEPRWRPPFITALAPEDRCHLNGLAVREGRVAFVTALGESDTAGGWRRTKAAGGLVVDVATNTIIARGLSMPHSPRWHEARLWLLNSGRGELITLDPASGRTTVMCELPGYLRGLCFTAQHALVGLCKIREKQIFGGLPIEGQHAKLQCGVAIVELASGRCVGMLEFTAGCTELFDVRFLQGVRRPNVLNLDKADIHEAIAAPACHYWLRPEFEIKGEPAL